MITIEMDLLEITDNRYRYGSCIVPRSMTRNDIVTSCPSLIDGPPLSDDIVVADISPSSSDGMILIDIPKEYAITRLSILDILSGMMDDDTIDLANLLDRPDQSMTVLDSLHGSILLRVRKEPLEFLSASHVGIDIIELFLSFG